MRFFHYFNLLLLLLLFQSCSNSNAQLKTSEGHLLSTVQSITSNNNIYSWSQNYDSKNAIVNRINVPQGFTRMEVKQESFADWLRYLPLQAGKPDVHLFNGNLKGNQKVHYAVVDIDVGKADLQQCADAVMRMRAEYLFSKKDFENLHFNFTSGDNIRFSKWVEGYRIFIKNNKIKFYGQKVQ